MGALSTIRKILLRRPPKTVSAELQQRFTMEGLAAFIYAYDDSSSRRRLHYTREMVDYYIDRAQSGESTEYGTMDGFLREAVERFPIRGKTVAIIGSEKPRYEAFCLAHEARPVTLEYSPITTDDMRLDLRTPGQVRSTNERFDVALSLSTYEHSGLGRYGDPIDPDGDLLAMKELKKIVVSGGLAFVAVPVGREAVFFNLHRVYGRERLKRLHEGWRVLASFGFDESNFRDVDGSKHIHQPVFVLANISAE
jgi:hypothetical protein